ncbi:radical SAM protein [Citrobacter sp. S2-9]|uniref:Radical SAM protein n=1 Tax=Citrobacter enshiensis TaxID=2971264 RepID=A0ABT8PYI9_9ENTR|nr:radical SAM protein [Citrobacter enshiensis]MDN8600756.1 radical SAM protein [Citrobacter enshiensis]
MTECEDMDVSEGIIKVVVDHQECQHPNDLYRNVQQAGVRSVQFIPLVERDEKGYLTAESVTSEDWGRFLNTVFDIWVREDVNRISIQLFDKILTQWCGRSDAVNLQDISHIGADCRNCYVLHFCAGECLKYRDSSEKSALCAGYKTFFNDSSPYMRVMRDLIKQHRSPMELMAMLRQT